MTAIPVRHWRLDIPARNVVLLPRAGDVDGGGRDSRQAFLGRAAGPRLQQAEPPPRRYRDAVTCVRHECRPSGDRCGRSAIGRASWIKPKRGRAEARPGCPMPSSRSNWSAGTAPRRRRVPCSTQQKMEVWLIRAA